MRTISFKSLLHSVSRRLGVDPESGDYTDLFAATIADFASVRVQEGVEWAFWPELMFTQRRQYRATWDAAETYAEAIEIYYDDNYYYSEQGSNTNQNPATEAAYWTLVADVADDDYAFDRYVSLEQVDETVMAEVESVSMRNPKTSNYPGFLDFDISENGVQPSSLAGNRVWVKFRQRPAELSAIEWESGSSYITGDVVYVDSTGECYKAILASTTEDPTTATTYWKLQEIPFVINKFLRRAVFADMLVEDGQLSKAERQEARAYVFLADAVDVTEGQQGQIKYAIA